MPMWQRQITFAPVRLSGPISPAVCGSWRRTTSSARTSSTSSARVGLERVLVDLARRVVEVAAVALEAVEEVVDALGDLEEVGVALDHGPARVDAGALGVADQRQQQLHHAPALGGRAHVPDRALAEQLAGGADAVGELLERLGLEHGLEALGRVRWDLDHFKHALCVSRPGVRATAPTGLGQPRTLCSEGLCSSRTHSPPPPTRSPDRRAPRAPADRHRRDRPVARTRPESKEHPSCIPPSRPQAAPRSMTMASPRSPAGSRSPASRSCTAPRSSWSPKPAPAPAT